MRRMFLFSLLAAALVLVGCQVTTGPGDGNGGIDPWQAATEATAASDPEVAVRTNQSVTRNAPDYYQVRLPAALNQPLVYVELGNVSGGNATVEVFSPATPRTSVYTSQSSAWFGLSNQVTSLEEELEVQRVNVTTSCRGPCIIFPREGAGTATDIYVRVSTTGATTVRYDLYVYDDIYNHQDEPQVSQCQGFPSLRPAALDTLLSVESPVMAAASGDVASTSIAPSSIIVEPTDRLPYRGALETVGNTDCYEIRQNVNRLELTSTTANTGINMVAVIFNANTGQELDFIGVGPNDRVATSGPLGGVPVRIIVYSSNNRAGPSETSWYEIDVIN